MDPEQWAKIETLFHQLRSLPAQERAAFFEQADIAVEVRREVESLLAKAPSSDESFHHEFAKAAEEAVQAGRRESEWLVGRNIGPYQVLSFVASGGMGNVYRARHSKLDRDVALKLLPPHVSQEPGRLERSAREAKLLASLSHSNIAAIYDLVDAAGIPCLVLEYVEGETLAERLKRGRVPLPEALDIARQIAEALEAAHERGIVHRDLKPGNVMITADGKVKVLDFGIARLLESEASAGSGTTLESLTAGVLIGTPAYMSPEQVKGQAVNRTADIWAFGCVLYEMLGGRRAFDGDSAAQILGRVSETEPDWNSLPLEIPHDLRRLVQRCLKKEARWRLQNIGDARIELEDVRTAAHVTRSQPKRTAGRNRLLWIFACAFLVIAAALAAFVFLRAKPPAEVRLEITTPPVDADQLSTLAISPDGQSIVFAATVSGETRLWLRSLSSSTARPLPGTENAEYPFWSPDSRSIGFFADQKLKRLDIDGGAARVLANAPLGRGGTWSRDHVIVFTPNNSGPAFRIPAAGGKAEAVTKIEGPGGNHRLPSFLPDGRHFLYWAGDGVYAAALDGSEQRRILEDVFKAEYWNGYIIYERPGSLFAQRFDPVRFTMLGAASVVADQVLLGAWSVSAAGPIIYRTGAAKADAQHQLVWFDRAGKPLEDINAGVAPTDLGMSLSPDAQHMAIVGRTLNADRPYLWLLELKRKTLTRFTDMFPATYPLWSPDGLRLVFGHFDPKTVMDLYRKSADGIGKEEVFLRTHLNKAATDWSIDGRFFLYRSPDPKTAMDIWGLRLDTNEQPFPVVRTDADERDAQFSPDHNWIAYQSNESGRFEIYVQPFLGPGPKHKVSTNGGAQVRWRRDGGELFYVALDGNLMSVPVRVTPDTKSIDAGAAVPLFAARVSPVQFDRQQYFVSADGQRFLINTVVEQATSPPITVILNYNPKSP
jgi:serine/threonine protein kinase